MFVSYVENKTFPFSGCEGVRAHVSMIFLSCSVCAFRCLFFRHHFLDFNVLSLFDVIETSHLGQIIKIYVPSWFDEIPFTQFWQFPFLVGNSASSKAWGHSSLRYTAPYPWTEPGIEGQGPWPSSRRAHTLPLRPLKLPWRPLNRWFSYHRIQELTFTPCDLTPPSPSSPWLVTPSSRNDTPWPQMLPCDNKL